MGSLVLVMVMVVLSLSLLLQAAEAQDPLEDHVPPGPSTTCLTSYGDATFSDAAMVVNALLMKSGRCCPKPCDGDICCGVQFVVNDSAATVCGPLNYCPSCTEVGSGLKNVLERCNDLNTVQGVYTPFSSDQAAFYLTANPNHAQFQKLDPHPVELVEISVRYKLIG
ncbi:unnamed protein product [Calypogeia fissa]